MIYLPANMLIDKKSMYQLEDVVVFFCHKYNHRFKQKTAPMQAAFLEETCNTLYSSHKYIISTTFVLESSFFKLNRDE
jgi:hypothetical protein